jgi:hypothetical protein
MITHGQTSQELLLLLLELKVLFRLQQEHKISSLEEITLGRL